MFLASDIVNEILIFIIPCVCVCEGHSNIEQTSYTGTAVVISIVYSQFALRIMWGGRYSLLVII